MTERISTRARLGEILSSLGEPTRRKIVDALGNGQLSVNEIVEIVGISQPAASKHLKILREAGVIVVRPDAQRRLYRVSKDAFLLLSAWAGEIASQSAPAGALYEDLTARPHTSAAGAPQASAPRRAAPAAPRHGTAAPAPSRGGTTAAASPRHGTAAASSSAPVTGAHARPAAAAQAEAEQNPEQSLDHNPEQNPSFLQNIPQLQNLPGLPRLSRFTRRLNGK